MDERFSLVSEALTHPEVTSSEADNLAALRRIAAEHLVEDAAVIERVRYASNAYLLAHEPDELARQARLVEPLPAARYGRPLFQNPSPTTGRSSPPAVTPTDCSRRLTEVPLTKSGLNIIRATIATWPDGAVLDSFVVRAYILSGAPTSPPSSRAACAAHSRLT